MFPYFYISCMHNSLSLEALESGSFTCSCTLLL
uniref:Uncharacterized protein n=1 Tax=Anguilla anguilla TaxID=7936 RepID=A0A0E9WL86_ANGAN